MLHMKYSLKANLIVLAIIVLSLLILCSCSRGPDSTRGFSLPKGDIEKGKAVFIHYRCLDCHSISGIDDGNTKKELGEPLILGGDVNRSKTYAELLTSIIHPSHRIAKAYIAGLTHPDGSSKMRNYNDVMTVTELINLVSFLQPYYHLSAYHSPRYPEMF